MCLKDSSTVRTSTERRVFCRLFVKRKHQLQHRAKNFSAKESLTLTTSSACSVCPISALCICFYTYISIYIYMCVYIHTHAAYLHAYILCTCLQKGEHLVLGSEGPESFPGCLLQRGTQIPSSGGAWGELGFTCELPQREDQKDWKPLAARLPDV